MRGRRDEHRNLIETGPPAGRPTILAAIALVAMIAIGCGLLPRAQPSIDWGPTFEELSAEATPEQQPYFVDGAITFAEYQAAVFAMVACVQGEGFRVRPELAADGFFQYGGAAADGVQEAIDACRHQWSWHVELAYQVSQGPSIEEMPMVEAVISCLRDAGQPPSLGTRVDQLRAFIATLPDESPGRACGRLLPAG